MDCPSYCTGWYMNIVSPLYFIHLQLTWLKSAHPTITINSPLSLVNVKGISILISTLIVHSLRTAASKSWFNIRRDCTARRVIKINFTVGDNSHDETRQRLVAAGEGWREEYSHKLSHSCASATTTSIIISLSIIV